MSDVPHYSPSTVKVINLVARLIDNDPDAWAGFQNRLPATVRAAVGARLSEADIHDLSQELYLKLREALPKYTPQAVRAGGFHGWLGKVTRRVTVDYFRRRANRPGGDPLPDVADITTSISSRVAVAVDGESLVAAVDRQVGDAFREPWVAEAWRLCWLDQLTAREIADRLGVGFAAVARTLHRVKTHLAASPEFHRLIEIHTRPPE